MAALVTERVRAFQDADCDWQVEGAFPKTWAAPTVGLTGLGGLVFVGLAIVVLRRSSQPR